jgi:phage terminase large subunit
METSNALTPKQKISLWRRCFNDWVFFIRAVLGVRTMVDFQEELVRAVMKNERVAVRSCHDMGKTWTMARLVLAFTSTRPRSKVVTTAPTARQVELLLWSEIRAAHAASPYPLGGVMLTKKWEIAPDWWAIGFTTQKQSGGDASQGQQNSGFQGIHAEHVLVIFDEATGIPPDVWKQLEGLMTSANVRFVAIGNPTTKACEFYQCFTDPTYKKIHLSCFRSPNLKANGFTSIADVAGELDRLREMSEDERLEAIAAYKVVNKHLVTAQWVIGRALKWGIDHPLFLSKCLGEFPEEDDRCLMPLSSVVLAQARPRAEGQKKHYIGVDVARFGGDKSVITHLHGVNVETVKALVKRDTVAVSGVVINIVNNIPEEERLEGVVITVDATGIGAGVADTLRAYQRSNPTWRRVQIRDLHFGETFKEGRDGTKEECLERNEQFRNKKAYAFKMLADDLKSELVLPPDAGEESVYCEELPTILYQFDEKGRWVIEDKDAYKKRTGRGSPDYSDSLAIANFGRYHIGGAAGWTPEMTRPNRKNRDQEY